MTRNDSQCPTVEYTWHAETRQFAARPGLD